MIEGWPQNSGQCRYSDEYAEQWQIYRNTRFTCISLCNTHITNRNKAINCCVLYVLKYFYTENIKMIWNNSQQAGQEHWRIKHKMVASNSYLNRNLTHKQLSVWNAIHVICGKSTKTQTINILCLWLNTSELAAILCLLFINKSYLKIISWIQRLLRPPSIFSLWRNVLSFCGNQQPPLLLLCEC